MQRWSLRGVFPHSINKSIELVSIIKNDDSDQFGPYSLNLKLRYTLQLQVKSNTKQNNMHRSTSDFISVTFICYTLLLVFFALMKKIHKMCVILLGTLFRLHEQVVNNHLREIGANYKIDWFVDKPLFIMWYITHVTSLYTRNYPNTILKREDLCVFKMSINFE